MALVGEYSGDIEKGRFHGKGLHAYYILSIIFIIIFMFSCV